MYSVLQAMQGAQDCRQSRDEIIGRQRLGVETQNLEESEACESDDAL